MESAYPRNARTNQALAPSWRALGNIFRFTWPTSGWVAALFLLWLIGPSHWAWQFVTLATFTVIAVLLWVKAVRAGQWLRVNRWAQFVPIMGEIHRSHRLWAKKRGNKYLRQVWPSITSHDGPLHTYLYANGGVLEWHVPGHAMIGDRKKVEHALSDALGTFERDFNVHHFEVGEAPGHRQQYVVHFFREAPTDPLGAPVSFSDLLRIPKADKPDYVVLGRTHRGEALPFRVLERHTLLVGASGSGKSSIIWSVLTGLADRIARGDLLVYGIDLKGGVEFTQGRHLFKQIIDSVEEVIPFLEDIVTNLKERMGNMKATGARFHQSSTEEPAVLILIDEAASLTYAFDAKDQKAITNLIRQITTTGRAAGFSTLAAMQDPRKEAFPARDTFTQQVGLRFRTAEDAKLALGLTAYNAGTHCETIPVGQPGTGYVIDTESTGDPIRFRAYYASDTFIRGLPAAESAQMERRPIPPSSPPPLPPDGAKMPELRLSMDDTTLSRLEHQARRSATTVEAQIDVYIWFGLEDDERREDEEDE